MSQPPILSPTAPASPSDETQSTDSSMQFNDTSYDAPWHTDPPSALLRGKPERTDDTACPGLQDYNETERQYVLQTYTHLDLLFNGDRDFSLEGALVYAADLEPQVLLDDQPCATVKLAQFTPVLNCHRILIPWPADSSLHNLSISVRSKQPGVSTQFSLAVTSLQGDFLYSSSEIPHNASLPTQNSLSNSVISTSFVSTTAHSASAAAISPTVAPAFGSSFHTAGSSKARIIVPCVVVPVVVILLIALGAYFWRRRTRAKMAPSAAFKMENPTFTPGETWVPIDEKRAFSPGPTKVGSGSSL